MSIHLLEEDSTIKEYKETFKSIGIVNSFPKKEDYTERLKLLKSHYTFPWRMLSTASLVVVRQLYFFLL